MAGVDGFAAGDSCCVRCLGLAFHSCHGSQVPGLHRNPVSGFLGRHADPVDPACYEIDQQRGEGGYAIGSRITRSLRMYTGECCPLVCVCVTDATPYRIRLIYEVWLKLFVFAVELFPKSKSSWGKSYENSVLELVCFNYEMVTSCSK